MTKREVVKMVLDGKRPPHVPWSFKFTKEPYEVLRKYYGAADLDGPVGNHILNLGSDIGFFEDLGNDLFQDVFGVIWNRKIDKDIGDVKGIVLPEPTLENFRFPDPLDPGFFAGIESGIAAKPDLFRVFQIGFSLYERAWTLRGMTNLLTDFLISP
jgi:uroporphyrinogen decarboxylase